MATLNNFISDGDTQIYVAFPLNEGETTSHAKVKIHKILSNAFQDDLSTFSFSEVNDKEIIVKFHKPVLSSDDKMSDFFSNLRDIFDSSTDYLPYFTQGSNT